MTEQSHSAQEPEVVVGEASEPTTADAAASQPVPDQPLPDQPLPDQPMPDQPAEPSQDAEVGAQQVQAEQEAVADQAPAGDGALAAERLADLQRLQAEYVNYKRRVDRDRALVQERAAQSVIEALLPVLDDIHAAREHGDLVEGPFAAIADKLEGVLGKFGLERYGEVGEEFDPNRHEALMHTAWPQDGSVSSTGSTTVVQVLQPGYRAGEQILRAARVAVADPE